MPNKKLAVPDGTETPTEKKTRKPRRQWPFMLTQVDGEGNFCPLPTTENMDGFATEADALAAISKMPDFVKEQDVRIIRFSPRIVQKPRKEHAVKMTFGGE